VSSHGPVELVLPRVAEMARVARLAASGCASTTNVDVATLEDITLVVSEVMLLLVENGSSDTVGVTFNADADEFVVEGHTPVAEQFDPGDPDVQLSQAVLTGIGATTLITVVDGILRLHARLGTPTG
jgi:anti-sigma regulatory factor (Ser/Thr protein kinase)